MKLSPRLFQIARPILRPLSWGDGVVFLGIAVLIYAGIRVGLAAPEIIQGPEINLSPGVLPYYASLSLGRMFAAYLLSVVFSMVYGSLAANHRQMERIMLVLLDVLQTIPILSFLPLVLLSFSAIFPQQAALELSSIFLIFTSQTWNLTFAWYQSLTTIPRTLFQASTIFGFNTWLRFKTLELPFAAISLIWNSMASWAGGWFFLMAAEIFSAGERNFRLPGLGAYLQEAANQGDLTAIAWGLCALVLSIVALDQLVWRPLLAWSERFKMQMVESENPPASWFYDVFRNSTLINLLHRAILRPTARWLDDWLMSRFPLPVEQGGAKLRRLRPWYLLGILVGLGLLYEAYQAGQMLGTVSLKQWGSIGVGLSATLLRVLAALSIALAWTVPLGVAIGTNQRLAVWLQPLVQIIASVPATALFPVLLLLVLGLPGGLNMAAVLLMLLGTQWYLLFNIIAGASAIPQELKYTSTLLQLGRWERWRTLILPAIFPYAITGAITAVGGAWNASIVAEYTQFGGRTFKTTGIGALIAEATAAGDYALLLAATLSLLLTVATINRLVWQYFYRLAEEEYRLE
ncbi:MAG: ABC transporter permease [Deltaproteobacteria bacterium RBG_13_58_19]|nr:MAG: ABC transporter permease [Deltaproteobacteria bacterium RBG_13_58_19]